MGPAPQFWDFEEWASVSGGNRWCDWFLPSLQSNWSPTVQWSSELHLPSSSKMGELNEPVLRNWQESHCLFHFLHMEMEGSFHLTCYDAWITNRVYIRNISRYESLFAYLSWMAYMDSLGCTNLMLVSSRVNIHCLNDLQRTWCKYLWMEERMADCMLGGGSDSLIGSSGDTPQPWCGYQWVGGMHRWIGTVDYVRWLVHTSDGVSTTCTASLSWVDIGGIESNIGASANISWAAW